MSSEMELYGVGNFLSAVVGNLTDILSARYTPKKPVSALRVTVALGAAAQFGYTVRNSAGATTPLLLLDPVALQANVSRTFVIGARKDYSYQFQISDAELDTGKVQYLTIEEVSAAAL